MERVKTLKAGESFDEFTIGGSLGKGFTATAYQAGEDVVVKLYTGDINRQGHNIRYEKFKNEANLLKLLEDSPHVLNAISDFREHAVHENTKKLAPYYAMERMDGSLRDLVFQPDLTLEEKLQACIQIVKGTADCHEKGVCHRDIWTPNILFKRTGQANLECKISDFGSAKQNGAKQETPYFYPMGNNRYTSPESAVGLFGGDSPDFEIMKVADVFALGLLMYEVLTGLGQENMNTALMGAVSIAQGSGMGDVAVTHDERKQFLQQHILPLLTGVKLNAIASSDILSSEEIADELNELVMDMLKLDYSERVQDLSQVLAKFELILKKVQEA